MGPPIEGEGRLEEEPPGEVALDGAEALSEVLRSVGDAVGIPPIAAILRPRESAARPRAVVLNQNALGSMSLMTGGPGLVPVTKQEKEWD